MFLWFTLIGFILFIIGMVLSVAYGDFVTRWREIQLYFFVYGGAAIFWLSLLWGLIAWIISLFVNMKG